MRCLESWLSQDPDEIIIVPDIGDIEVQRRLAEVTDPRVRVIVIQHQGKRSALGVGIKAAVNEIIGPAGKDMQRLPPTVAVFHILKEARNARQH